MATCWAHTENAPCTEPITDVVLVPTYEERTDPWQRIHPFAPFLTCSDHAPELMHELLTSDGYEREELITATVATPTVTTWADARGVWHAKVPNTPHRHEMTAYQAIRAEITARQAAAVPAFGLAVVTEDATTITYREDWDSACDAALAEWERATVTGKG